jgi:hypothetical protein
MAHVEDTPVHLELFEGTRAPRALVCFVPGVSPAVGPCVGVDPAVSIDRSVCTGVGVGPAGGVGPGVGQGVAVEPAVAVGPASAVGVGPAVGEDMPVLPTLVEGTPMLPVPSPRLAWPPRSARPSGSALPPH